MTIHSKTIVFAANKAQLTIDGLIKELELFRMLHKVFLASLLFFWVDIMLVAAKRHISLSECVKLKVTTNL